MSVSSHTQGQLTLVNLLQPMQFKTVLLVACGLKNSEIAGFLGTTEQVVTNALKDVYERTGCWNSSELVRRYFREVASGLLELGRLQRELAELEARAGESLSGRLEDGLRLVH
jgi:DNA-binding CsgD family transcriptional regulator